METKNDFSMFLGTVAEPASAGYGYAQIYISTESYYSPVEKPAKETELKFDFDNGAGILEKIERKDTSTITAQWIPWGNQNRRSSPMLSGGETVVVIRIAGIKKYFYTTFFSDLDLKAQDVIEYVFPSRPRVEDSGGGGAGGLPGGVGGEDDGLNTFIPDPEKPGNELTASYKLIIDTSDEVQQVFFKTTNYNGERSILTVNLDCKKGRIMLFNDRGEVIGLESSLPAGEESEGSSGEGGGEDEPGRLRFATSGYTLLKSTQGRYNELLDGSYTKLTGDDFRHISNVSMWKIGCEVKEVEGPVVYNWKDKATTVCKDIYGVKTLEGDMLFQSGANIGLTTASGNLKVFAGGEINIISPKVGIVSPAVTVTGTLTGAAISMGSAPSPDNKPLLITPDEINWEKFDEEMEKVTTLNQIAPPEEEESEEEEEKEEEEEEEEEEKEPEEVDGKGDSKDALFNMEGEIELKAQKNIKLEATQNLEMKANQAVTLEGSQSVSIDGKGGTAIKGGGQDLVDILKTFFQDLQTALNSDLAASTITGAGTGANGGGPIATVVTAVMAPVLTNTIKTCTQAMTNIIAFKGGASRSVLGSELDEQLFNVNLEANESIKEIPESNLDFKLKTIKSKLAIRKRNTNIRS